MTAATNYYPKFALYSHVFCTCWCLAVFLSMGLRFRECTASAGLIKKCSKLDEALIYPACYKCQLTFCFDQAAVDLHYPGYVTIRPTLNCLGCFNSWKIYIFQSRATDNSTIPQTQRWRR